MTHPSARTELPGPSIDSSPLPQSQQLDVSDGAHFDVVIIGSGAGGGTLARHLGASGLKVLVLERGDWLPQEPQLERRRGVPERSLHLEGHLA
jgi:hypothetical protein